MISSRSALAVSRLGAARSSRDCCLRLLLPVELVNQFDGKVRLQGLAPPERQIEPVEVSAPLVLGDRVVLSGAVQDPQVVVLAEELIDLAGREVGSFDAKGRFTAVVVSSVNETTSWRDQCEPAMGSSCSRPR